MAGFDLRGWLGRVGELGVRERDQDSAEDDVRVHEAFDLGRWFAGVGSASHEELARASSPAADAQIRAALNALPVTMFEFDANGIYLCAAGRYVGLFGVSAAQIVGRSVFDFPRFVPGKNMMARRALRGKTVTFTGIWPRGRYMIRLHPRFDASGRVSSVVGLGYELTTSAAADGQIDQLLEALRQSEARFRAMCEGMPLGIFVSNPKLEVGYVNPALCELLDRAPEELLGREWRTAVHAEDRDRMRAARGAGDAGGYDGVVRLVRRGGVLVWTSLRVAEMREGLELLGYVGAVTDITQERNLHAQLLVTERLLSVGTMAAGVSHEINNPLAAVLSNLEWVAGRVSRALETPEPAGASDESALRAELRRLERPIAEARDAAERVRAIVRDLKLFSRSEEDLSTPVDLTAVLDSAARMAWNEVRHRARFVRGYGDLPLVQGSDARLGQVFLNLIINAAQAIPEGHSDENEIRVSARALPPASVVVEVQDTGSGMPADVLGRIFDPFFTTKPPRVGTGLGLAICHRIVTSLGGHIEVESQPGRGSTFRVTLVAADAVATPRAPASVAPAASPAASTDARGRVMVVDDDAAMGRTLSLLLGDDHAVTVFTSPRAALARLRDDDGYDAIICDVMMPEMGGSDFHAELASFRPELAARVIFVTGGAFTLHAREFLDRVSNPCLDKPFDTERLRALVEQQVWRARERQQS